MKTTTITTYSFSFEMKDKKQYTFAIQAKDIKEARALLLDHMNQIIDDIEKEIKEEKKREEVTK